MFLSEWHEFPSTSRLAGGDLMTTRVSMLLKSRASMTCFRACFLLGRAKDLLAPRVCMYMCVYTHTHTYIYIYCIYTHIHTHTHTIPGDDLSEVETRRRKNDQ